MFLKSQNSSQLVGKTEKKMKFRFFENEPKKEARRIHVGKVRNFTDGDVVLTLLDPKFKYSMAFALSDTMVLKTGCPGGVDLSKAIEYEQSSGYTPLFELKKNGSEYLYRVFAHCNEFVVQKFKLESQIGLATKCFESKKQVATYRIGDEENRCITI
jgi:hypothetical protein